MSTPALSLPARAIAQDDPVPGVKNVVLVMSGKGGVGKSTVAANLAVELARMGARVGLLDADIYGPSVPTMFGIMEHPGGEDGRIETLERHGVKLMSIGFLLEDATTAVAWRGPMLHSALLQFLKDVAWGELDLLLLDLPPGTGDVVLTLAQNLASTGAVIVTTPQEVAIQDVYKAVTMCKKVHIPLLGVVENQSWFVCEHGTRHELFGRGGGAKVAALAGAPLLGQVPLDIALRECGDAGHPVVDAKPEAASAQALAAVTRALLARVAEVNATATGLAAERAGGAQRHLPVTR